jgi:PTS system mannose-specific IIA component
MMRTVRSSPEPGAGVSGDGLPPPVGVVVVTHGLACDDLVNAAEAIVGAIADVVSVPTEFREAADSIQRRVGEAVGTADLGRGVLLLCDLHGSTPANACQALVEPGRIDVVYGVNLPMLIKLSTCDRRAMGPTELGEFLRETGRRSIRLGSELRGPGAAKGT